MGADIDIRVLRGKEKDQAKPAHCKFARTLKDVEIGPLSNFKQYGLSPPDLVRCDNANPVWSKPNVSSSWQASRERADRPMDRS